MIPIKDTIRSRSFPLVNWLLIITNVLVFLFEISLGQNQLDQFISIYGLVPAHLNLANPLSFFPFFSYMFLHGGWLHIISNMWVLFIFGDNVEDRLGSLRYLIFYLLGGLAAAVLQVVIYVHSTVPSIGASGAIAAVMGAYFTFYPKAKVVTLVPIWIIPWFIDIPAVIFLGLWFLLQLFSGFLALSSAQSASMGGVAWWAHVGGFVFGLLICRLFEQRKLYRQYYPDEYYPW